MGLFLFVFGLCGGVGGWNRRFVALTYFGKENFHISGVAAGFVWAMFANVNYYKLKVLREKNWV